MIRIKTLVLVTIAIVVMWLVLDQMALENLSENLTPSSNGGRQVTAGDGGHLIPGTPEAVAVLPLEPLSNGPEDDYLFSGLTEELSTRLSQVPGLRVFADRNSATHVFEGTAFRAGERLEITARLSDNEAGTNVWTRDYRGDDSDAMNFLRDITDNVSRALGADLDAIQQAQFKDLGTQDVDAFIAFHKGRQLFNRGHAGHNLISMLRQANQHFESAIRIDPRYMPAHIKHADLSMHILFSHASGRLDGNVSSDDVSRAEVDIVRDYEGAIRSADSEAMRRRAQIDRAMLLGNWTGLGRELKVAFRRMTACESGRIENRKFRQAMEAALNGDRAQVSELHDQLIGESGPDDGLSLVLYSVQGRLHEANRLASQIDRRPFGHMVLFRAVRDCACGAPFSVSATPGFATMLEQSGMEWPPVKRNEFPLKDW